jgi:hypothetical protein
MDEIKELKERIEFLEQKYKDLVDEILGESCQCQKPMWMHLGGTEEQIKEYFLNKIK